MGANWDFCPPARVKRYTGTPGDFGTPGPRSYSSPGKRRNAYLRRVGRVVEGARLESVYTVLNGIEGSNPSLSALFPTSLGSNLPMPAGIDQLISLCKLPIKKLSSLVTEDKKIRVDPRNFLENF